MGGGTSEPVVDEDLREAAPHEVIIILIKRIVNISYVAL